MIDVRKLRMLAALDRLGTIAAVAAELHLTAPGVSMQLSALEKEIDVTLTQRQGRRVVLTAAGRVLALHGHEILDRISLAEFELDAIRSGTVGRYAVSAFPSAARTIVADVCRRVIADESALEVTLRTAEPEQTLEAVTSGGADLGVIHSYTNVPRDIPSGISTRLIGSEPVWLATRADGVRTDTAPARLQDYADQSWITPTQDVTCFGMVERACGVAGFRPRIVAETMDFAVQLELVAAGMGVALVPELTIAAVPAGVILRALTTPVERSLFVAARTPNFADPGIVTLTGMLEESANGILASRTGSSATR